MTQKTFAAGSEFPPLQKDVLRIYSMRFCPFAHRTRLVLAHKEIPHETVNVHLKQKPDWFLARNPLGLVPTLEKNDLVIYDSAICDDYLDEVYPQKKLTPSDPYTKARHRMIGEHFSKPMSASFAISRGEEGAVKKFMEALDPMEKLLEDNFFGGKEVAMIDYHMWPFFERFAVFSKMTGTELLPKDRFPKLVAYVKRMNQQPAVKATQHSVDTYIRFRKSAYTANPEYDIDL